MENFHKYKKIKHLDHEDVEDIFSDSEDEIIIQEKMDGANFRFIIKDGKLIFGSRGRQLTNDEGEDEEDKNNANFILCLEHIRDALKDKDLSKYEGLTFYGECMIKHTVSYDWPNIPPFLGFDIMTEDEAFLHPTDMVEIFEELGLETVPELTRVYASEIKDPLSYVPITKYPPVMNPSQLAEGVVFKNHDKQLYSKFVRDEFKEDNKKMFGEIAKFTDTTHDLLTAKYCTNARIEKMIWKMLDDGDVLDLPMIPKLSGLVYHDIWEENWKAIVKLNKAVDMNKFRKTVLNRCKSVLKQVIVNNSILSKE